MAYSKTTWVDGDNRYSTTTQGDAAIDTDFKLLYIGTAVPAMSATNLNNIEDGIEGNETLITAGDFAKVTVNNNINNQTGTTYTLALADNGKKLYMTNASAITLTVPPQTDVAFPVGFACAITQFGAGAVTFAKGAGVDIFSHLDLLEMIGQYAGATLERKAEDVFILTGNLV